MNWNLPTQVFSALTAWREARGEGRDGMRAVLHVIKNRMVSGQSALQIEEAKWQFSSMTAPGDPQLIVWPRNPEPAFELAMDLADQIILQDRDFDLTYGATHYFNPNVVLPSWAAKMTKTVSLGHHDFYK